MKKRIVYGFFLLAVAFVISQCTNKKNTVVTRAYHNLTSRYNGYYWATESIKDGVFKIEQGYKDDYARILPLLNLFFLKWIRLLKSLRL
jgi:hypothetical protein